MASFSYVFDICNFYFPEGSPGAGAVGAHTVPAAGPALSLCHSLEHLFYWQY